MPVKTQQYNINCALQRHVSTRRSHHQATFKTIFKMYKVTVHIWGTKGLTRLYYNNIIQCTMVYYNNIIQCTLL